jgi:hypothetical protein
MRDKNVVKTGKNRLFKHGLFSVAALLLLTACEIAPTAKLATDPTVSYLFKGFTLSPPKSGDWYRSELNDTERAVFRKTLDKNTSQVSAVVTPFETRISRKVNEPLVAFLERALIERYHDHAEFTLLALNVKPLTLNNAECVEFEAQHGKRYFPPVLDVLRPSVDFIHQGYICQHPVLPLFIQGIVTKYYSQNSDLRLDSDSLEDAQHLIRSIQFTAP